MEIEPAWVVATCAGVAAVSTLIAHIKNDAVKNTKNREEFRRFRKQVKKFIQEAREKLPK